MPLRDNYLTAILVDTPHPPVAWWRLGDSEGYAQAVLSDAPVGYWRLGDAAASSTASDTSGNGHTGTVNVGVTFAQAGAISDGNTAALFDGVNHGAAQDITATVPTLASTFSIEAWIKTSNSGEQHFAEQAPAQFYINGGAIVLQVSGGAINSASLYADGNWHHVVGTHDGTNARIYVDGVLAVGPTAKVHTTDTPTTFYIGRYQNGTNVPFGGSIDEVAVYSYALSAQQVANHYALRTSSIATVAKATVADASGNGDTGTVNGGVTLGQPGALVDGNTAALFDGATGCVTIPNAPWQQISTFSVECWVKLTAAGDGGLVTRWLQSGNQRSWLLFNNADRSVTFSIAQDGAAGVSTNLNSVAKLTIGAWYHIVATVDAVALQATLYINGAVDNSAACVAPFAASTAPIQVGSGNGTTQFVSGTLDEVAFYNSVLSAQTVALHYAARLNTANQKSLMETRSGPARAGAARSDYYRQFPVLTIAGVDRTSKIWKGSLSIETLLTQQPNTATVKVFGFEPSPGQQVIIGSGAISNRVFGGSVLRSTQNSVRGNAIDIYDVELIDWVRDLNKRLVFKSYAAGQSASLVFTDLAATYTVGFSTAKVKAGGPTLSGPLVFSGTSVTDAFTQVTDATPGWHWKVDPNQVLHFYDTETVQRPSALSATNFLYDLLNYTLDISQVRTRFYGIGGGAQTTAPVAALATSIPVDDCAWYASGGGMLLTPYADQITYTGLSASSGPGNLTGCSGLTNALKQGDRCAVFVIVNDLAAQAALALIEGGTSDGIREGKVQGDGTWSLATTTAQATAALAAFRNEDVRGTYETRDKLTTVGAQVPITIPRRNISTTVTLQKVTRHLIAKDHWGYTCEFAALWSDLIDLITGTVQAA